jgi:hypothetical protein
MDVLYLLPTYVIICFQILWLHISFDYMLFWLHVSFYYTYVFVY